MKYVFLIAALLLAVASVAVWASLPGTQSDLPIVYWVTDANPARHEQVKLFHQWQVRNGHGTERAFADAGELRAFLDRQSPALRAAIADVNLPAAELLAGRPPASFPVTLKLPAAELRLDMANRDRTKQVVQGVSGVAGDVMDQWSGADMRYMRAIGLNTDVTDAARQMGFDLAATFPAIEPEIMLRDPETGRPRQYQFPCNVVAPLYFVNRATFRQHGVEPPPNGGRWTIEEFERLGKTFVAKANAGLPRPTVFFADQVPLEVLRAGLGGSSMNETCTRPTLDTPENLRALQLVHKWTHEDRLLPSAADRQSFSVDAGYGGQNPQVFVSADPARGQFALHWSGRHQLIGFRDINAARVKRGEPPLDLGVCEAPHGGFPNTTIGTRAAMVYAGGPHPRLATLFLAFLASEEYNQQIVADADSLPPNPRYTESEAFRNPPGRPEEHGLHEPFARAARETAVGNTYSPFVLGATFARIEGSEREAYMFNRKTAERAAADMQRLIGAEVDRNLTENVRLRPLYDKLWARQQEIDRLRERLRELEASGAAVPDEARIPLDWIENPFHRTYYQRKGWTR